MAITKYRRFAGAVLVTISLVALLLGGCYHIPVGPATPVEPVKPASTASAVFSFGSIEVSPLPATAGQSVSITFPVENTGTIAGTYKADLMINGSLVSSQAVTVSPGNKAKAVFQASVPNAGKYEIKIGPQSKTIDVAAPRVQATLKIGGDYVDGFDPLVGSTSNPTQVHDIVEGHMIKLTAPAEGFVINSIGILGYIKSSTYDYDHDPVYGPGIWVYGSDIAAAEPLSREFTVNIYDIKRNRLYSGNFSKSLFTYTPGWVVVDLPSVKVAGEFLVEVKTNNSPRLNATGWGDRDPWQRYVVHTWYYQICIGYENSTNVQSFASLDGSVIPERPFTYNWLIQASGYKQ